MASSIPDTIQVGPLTYRVVVDEAAIDKASHDGGGEHGAALIGHSDTTKLEILLRPLVGHDLAAVTVLHEVLHAITAVTGLDEDLGDKKEEALVNRLAPALLDLLRRNPDLVAFLVGQPSAYPPGVIVRYG